MSTIIINQNLIRNTKIYHNPNSVVNLAYTPIDKLEALNIGLFIGRTETVGVKIEFKIILFYMV